MNASTSRFQQVVGGKSAKPFIPKMEEVTPIEEDKWKQYLNDLQVYFINGTKTSESLAQEVWPIRFAAFLKEDSEEIESDLEETEDSVEPIEFSGKTVFEVLDTQNQQRGEVYAEFLKDLKKVINGLNDLLLLEGSAPDLSMGQLGFADELISFDKIRDVALDQVSSHLPESTLSRVKWALKVLMNAQESFSRKTMTVFVTEQLNQLFDLKRILRDAKIEVVKENACHQARVQSKKEIREFVEIIAALRMGTLLIEQKYDDQLHDPYFEQFDLDHLSEKDLKYLSPTIAIEDARNLMHESNEFLSLLTNDSFVKILGVNLVDNLFEINKQDELNYLELASLAIFRRSSYVFQGGMDQEEKLAESFGKGLAFPGSVFWNILLTDPTKENGEWQYLEMLAAIESRYFPRIEYVANDNHFAFQQIKLQNNPNPEATFSTYDQTIKSITGEESKVFNFTIAEFLAMNSQLKTTLEIVPPAFQSTNLIPLAEYLSLTQDMVHGKTPFVWMVDGDDNLRQVVIPIKWIQRCRSRLEYWDFLQSIAGINKVHLQNTINELKTEWEEAKVSEIEALKATLSDQFEQEKSGILERGVSNMLLKLINEDNLENALTELSQTNPSPRTEVKTEQTSTASVEAKVEVVEEEPAVVIEEAWVESDECTSCKDCIVAVPSVFKFDDNKQAFVYNPTGGTFAQIVAAAEKCPARCIHPGVPQNKNEASLDKWVKRAEKFN